MHRSSPVATARRNTPTQTSHEPVQNTGMQSVCSDQTATTERAPKRTTAALGNHHRSRKGCHCITRADTGIPSSRTKGSRIALVRLNYALSATLLLLVLGCTDVADDRAERDERVGHFHDPQVRLDIDDGLAAIRSATGDRIVLWSSAPGWSATLRTADPRALELELRNIVPGSALLASTEGGSPLRVALADEPLPTQRHFVVAAHQGDTRLTLVPPGAHDATPFRFAVLSDIQSAVTRIQSMFERLNAEHEVSFVLSVGDLTDRGKREQLDRFETELRELSAPFYATLGNHELFGGTPPFQEVFGRASFHFHFRDTAFSLVDSGSATLAPKVEAWLDQWLEEDRSRTHVFATHIPPIDPIGTRGGAFTSKLEARQLIANLAEGKVDLAVYGHIHSYYEFTTAGVRSYISGGGGGRPELFDGIERHYLLVDVGTTGITSVRKVEVD
ncbi:MAG TPA: metallophosphoesterase [Polyangiaceae bacterium]|nr:metallophosphoesterase [Polyangiaceae bacterium]